MNPLFVRLSLSYFFYFSLLGAFVPFAIRWFTSKGELTLISVQQASTLIVLFMLAQLFAPLLFARLADRGLSKKLVLRWGSVFQIFCLLALIVSQDFWALALSCFLIGIPLAANLPQLEAVTLGHIEGKQHLYGRIRMWGSFGFLTTTLLAGWTIHQFGVFSVGVLMLLATFGFLVSVWQLDEGKRLDLEGKRSKNMLFYLRQFTVILVLVLAFFWQVGFAIFNSWFDPWLLQLGYSSENTGQWFALGVLCEMILLPFLSSISSNRNIVWLLSVSLVLTALRWFGIVWWIDYPWVITSLMLIHALSYGGVHLCFLLIFSRLFPANLQVTAQALYVTVAIGAGIIAGNQMAGWVVSHYQKIEWVFYIAGSVTLVAGCLALLLMKSFRAVETKKAKR
jgi:MFS transporter, PPP family, 3-phenylpropionic acid transporter